MNDTPIKPIPNMHPNGTVNVDFLNEIRAMSTEEERALERAEELLDAARFQKVMRMTARAFGKLEPAERRNYARWAKAFARTFAEKAAMFERNSQKEPELPSFLMRRQAD
jgi:hypothetical protein